MPYSPDDVNRVLRGEGSPELREEIIAASINPASELSQWLMATEDWARENLASVAESDWVPDIFSDDAASEQYKTETRGRTSDNPDPFSREDERQSIGREDGYDKDLSNMGRAFAIAITERYCELTDKTDLFHLNEVQSAISRLPRHIFIFALRNGLSRPQDVVVDIMVDLWCKLTDISMQVIDKQKGNIVAFLYVRARSSIRDRAERERLKSWK